MGPSLGGKENTLSKFVHGAGIVSAAQCDFVLSHEKFAFPFDKHKSHFLYNF